MARLKGKRNASSSKSSSKVNNGAETDQGEANTPSPTELMKVEEAEVEVATDKENAVEEEVDEGNIAEEEEEEEEEEEDDSAEEDKNGENALEITNGEENDREVAINEEEDKNGENALETTNSEENDREVAINEENGVEEVAIGGKTAGEQEGEDDRVDKEKNGENVDEYEGEIEQEDINEDAMEEKEIEEENRGGNGEEGIEDNQDVVEEEKGEENSKGQHVGIPEKNSEQQKPKSRKRNRRKKLAKGPAGKPELSGRKKVKMADIDTEQGDKFDEKDASSDGNKDKEKVAPNADNGAEIAEEINGKEVGESSQKRVIKLNKGSRRNNNVAEGNSKSEGGPGTSNKKNAPKKAESMGMIFMCSSMTKQDCYRYKVLGLPAGKRNVVEKIYKGMRLFLYDVDLKLLYGIYKASARGGYDIEPKAFNSQFPAQVRYQIIEDCLPLAEEKFRKVIKDNYYTRSKFNCQLNSEQVKNLFKLFVRTGKVSRCRKLGRSPRAATKKPDRGRRRRDEVRRPSLRDKSRQHERRRTGDSPVAPLLRYPLLPPPITGSSYTYERTAAREAYSPRREAYRHEAPREAYRQELPREAFRQEPMREVYRQEPVREVYRQEPVREVYRQEPVREFYRLDPPVQHRESYSQPRLLDLRDAFKRDSRLERDSFRQEPLLEHRDSLRREPLLEHRDSLRREPLLERRDSVRQEPLLERRDSVRREPLLEHRDSLGREPLLEHRDSGRREPLLEHRNSARSEPVVEHLDVYRRVPSLKHSESYRQERLLEHRDLYRQEHRDHRLVNVEPRRKNEMLNLEPRRHNEIDSRYSDRAYSTVQPPEYRRGVDIPAEGVSVVYRPTTTVPPPEYYSRQPLYR